MDAKTNEPTARSACTFMYEHHGNKLRLPFDVYIPGKEAGTHLGSEVFCKHIIKPLHDKTSPRGFRPGPT